MASSDIYWDQVLSVEPADMGPVYDLTIPEHHNFVANDIVVHNSLEQDQDSVLFIHRPESYGQSEFTYWQGGKEYTLPSEGLAKFIIRKQRNGPTGEFLARWDRTLTLFSPYKLDTVHEFHPSTANGDAYDYNLDEGR